MFNKVTSFFAYIEVAIIYEKSAPLINKCDGYNAKQPGINYVANNASTAIHG